MRASIEIERAGVRSVALVSAAFHAQARAVARAWGAPDPAIAQYPGVIPTDTDAEFRAKVQGPLSAAVLEALGESARVASEDKAEEAFEPHEIVFTGTYDQVLDHYTERLWTDGLPIVPPTRRRVDAFLAATSRPADEVLGVLPPELRPATVLSVAVNGVMAGCSPESMPVLLAAVDTIADPAFRLEDAGSTPGWEPLIVLSGPLARDLGFHSGAGVLRVGHRANTSVGRFLRLYLRNVAGFRIPPGDQDKASIGSTFNVALAEDDHPGLEGWPSLREELGLAIGETAVMVQSVVATSPPIYSGGDDAVARIEPITHHMASTCGPWAYTGIQFGRWHPLLVISASVAAAFARNGWSKDDVRNHLYENATIERGWFERYPRHVQGAPASLARWVEQGLAPADYLAGDGPDLRIPVLRRPEWTNIVIAGDAGRNQCRIYVNNHEQGPPTVRVVDRFR